jgi:hypothetical protein
MKTQNEIQILNEKLDALLSGELGKVCEGVTPETLRSLNAVKMTLSWVLDHEDGGDILKLENIIDRHAERVAMIYAKS